MIGDGRKNFLSLSLSFSLPLLLLPRFSSLEKYEHNMSPSLGESTKGKGKGGEIVEGESLFLGAVEGDKSSVERGASKGGINLWIQCCIVAD